MKKHVTEGNLRFEKELTDYKVEKVGKAIVDKLKARTELIKQHTDNQAPIVKPALINFPTYLKVNSIASLSRWILLNDAVREEHPALMPLSDLGSDDPVFAELAKRYFTQDFLRLSKDDKNSLDRIFA